MISFARRIKEIIVEYFQSQQLASVDWKYIFENRVMCAQCYGSIPKKLNNRNPGFTSHQLRCSSTF